MSEWSNKMAQRIKEASAERKAAAERSYAQKKSRDDWFDQFRDQIGGRLFEMCRELDEEKIGIHLVCEWKGGGVVVSRTGTSAAIRVSYNKTTYTIEVNGVCPDGSGYGQQLYFVKLNQGYDGYIVTVRDTKTDVEAIADSVIAALVEA